ncbi:MAG: FAD-dependent thymidylate synthase [Leptonema sp. (in: Bacteria)]|nr:FAD-dependent thymidylate synthase [Leptonema sp. (in: bacteria)]
MSTIQVRLLDATKSPYDLSIASARTCYSSKGIVLPEQISATPKAIELRDRIAKSTLQAGHLTTRQHPHFIFTIDNVSRHLVWSFLHSHPFYNSEQVSQRYVEVKADRFHTPNSLDRNTTLKSIYLETIQLSMNAYFQLMELLEPQADQIFYKIFPARHKSKERWQSTIHKKVIEAARYILPVATHTYLYHTINGLTLHRYRRMANACDVPAEAKELVDAMWLAVKEHDPLYADEMTDTLPIEETTEFQFFTEFFLAQSNQNESLLPFSDSIERQISKEFVHEFDASLGIYTSKFVGANADGL